MPDAPIPARRRVVVMGVAGSGKSTVAELVGDRLGTSVVEADDLHPPANVAKMASGRPLTDADRAPWLAAVTRALATSDDVVVTCSALRRAYRDVLRRAGSVTFVFLDVDADTARRRLAERRGHFMGPEMVASQFAALERPDSDEDDVLAVDATVPAATVVVTVVRALGEIGGAPVR